MKIFLTTFLAIVILIAIIFSAYLFTRGSYRVQINMASEKGYGLILYEFPVDKKKGKNVNYDGEVKETIFVKPAVPTNWSAFTRVGRFANYNGKRIPKKITINYQYANLDDCSVVDKRRPSMMENGKKIYLESTYYIEKIGCKNWEPVGEIKTKTIDLTSIQESKEFKRIGEASKSSDGYYMARIYFVFKDDDTIETRIENYTTNRWK